MIYVVTDWSGAVKIGVTQQLKSRLVSLQTGNPRKIDVLMTFETESLKQDKKLEKILHSEFRKQKIVLENGTETEWFDDSVLDVIGKNTSRFLAHIRQKYCFNSDVKSSVGMSFGEVESRRISNLKNVICDSDIYKGTIHVQGELIDKKPKFKIGDTVKLNKNVNVHCWYGGFSGAIRMPTEDAKVVSINDDCKTCDFYYELDNGYAYSEEMLELHNRANNEDVSNDRYILCTSKVETQAVLNNLGNDGYKWPSGCLAFNYNPYASTIYKAIYIICKEDKCLHWENAVVDVAKGNRTVKASDYLSGSV